MARRGEGQFIATEVNLRNDPKVLGLARRLKVHKLHAVGLVTSWREFVLERGTGSGIVKGYSRGELAEFLDWAKGPSLVIDALKAAGMLAIRRGSFVYPFWAETRTGHYAHKKSDDAARKMEERDLRRRWGEAHPNESWPGFDAARERLGRSADVPRNVHGQSADGPETNGQKESKGPPEPPLPGGVGIASAREGLTEWFFEMHPRMRNESECRRLLERMTEVQAVQLRYCLPRQRPKYLSGMRNRNGRGVPWADKYLRDGFWCEIRPPKPKAEKNGATRAEEQQEKADLVEREKAWWGRRDLVREQLKAAGVRLPKHELEARIDEELAKEDGGTPS